MNSRAKGVRGERQWRDELRANGYAARRGQQFSGSPDSPDVVCEALSWAHFEVKFVERLDLYAAMDQARRDSLGRAAFVAHRRNFWPWLVSMDAERFCRFVEQDQSGRWAETLSALTPETVCARFAWLHCQVIEGRRLNIHEAIADASRKAAGRVAVVAHRRVAAAAANGEGWVITMTAEKFFQFLRGTLPPESTGAQRQESTKTEQQ